MVDKATAPQEAPTTNNSDLPDDSKQWAELAKELGDEGEGEGEKEAEPSAKTGDDKQPAPEPEEKTPEDKPKLTYEQLESNYKNAQGAFTVERERAKRAEESLQAVNKLIEDLRAARKPPQPEPEQPKLPDVNEDPIGHFQAKVALLEQQLAQASKGTQETQQHLQAQHQERIFWDHVKAAEDEFRKTSPEIEVDGRKLTDYDAACEHLKRHRMEELQHLYPDTSAIAQHEAQQNGFPSPAHMRLAILQRDAAGIAQRAFQLGISPAQLYYEAAKSRGYKTPTPRAPNGQFKGNGSEKIEAAKRGQKAALTISGGEGRKSSNDMTLSDLSELWAEDPEAFDKEWERMKRAGKL